jgi:hypothetical protein
VDPICNIFVANWFLSLSDKSSIPLNIKNKNQFLFKTRNKYSLASHSQKKNPAIFKYNMSTQAFCNGRLQFARPLSGGEVLMG